MSGIASPLLNRLAALALLLIAVAAVALFVVMPVAGRLQTQSEAIGEQRELLGRLNEFTAESGTVERAAVLSEAALSGGIFLTGDTDALRTANLQALITEIASTHGIRPSSSRTLAVQEQNGLRFIGVQVEMDADIRQLQALVLALESRRPVLFIRSLQITPTAIRRPDSEELRIRLGVAGAAGTAEAKL